MPVPGASGTATGTEGAAPGAVRVAVGVLAAGAEPAGAGVAERVAVGVLAAGALLVGTGDAGAVAEGEGEGAVGFWVAFTAGLRAAGIAEAEGVGAGLGLAACLESSPLPWSARSLPGLLFPSRFWPGAFSRAALDWPFSGATTGRDWVSTAGAPGSPGPGAPSFAWDAGTPVVRTSTAPTAAAAAPRRSPPWIPVRGMEKSDLL